MQLLTVEGFERVADYKGVCLSVHWPLFCHRGSESSAGGGGGGGRPGKMKREKGQHLLGKTSGG